MFDQYSIGIGPFQKGTNLKIDFFQYRILGICNGKSARACKTQWGAQFQYQRHQHQQQPSPQPEKRDFYYSSMLKLVQVGKLILGNISECKLFSAAFQNNTLDSAAAVTFWGWQRKVSEHLQNTLSSNVPARQNHSFLHFCAMDTHYMKLLRG